MVCPSLKATRPTWFRFVLVVALNFQLREYLFQLAWPYGTPIILTPPPNRFDTHFDAKKAKMRSVARTTDAYLLQQAAATPSSSTKRPCRPRSIARWRMAPVLSVLAVCEMGVSPSIALASVAPSSPLALQLQAEDATEIVVLTVPGGGIVDNEPAPWSKARLDAAAEWFAKNRKKHYNKGKLSPPADGKASTAGEHTDVGTTRPASPRPTTYRFAVLSAGTPHLPMPTENGKTLAEGGAAARYLIQRHGIPAELILEENASLDTIGNAYFLRVIHLEALTKSLTPRGRVHVVLFTSEFHMPRTKAIFEHVLGLPWTTSTGAGTFAEARCEMHTKTNEGTCSSPSSEPTTTIDGQQQRRFFTLELHETENRGVGEEQLVGRRAREAKSLETFVTRTKPQLKTLTDLHGFIFTQHTAYASRRWNVGSGGDASSSTEVDTEIVRQTYR